jgi:exopolysaccharide biosynthesis polyprenyl glycosylphosphotransferase
VFEDSKQVLIYLQILAFFLSQMLTKSRLQKIWKTAILPIIDFLSVHLGILVVYMVRYNWFQESFLDNRRLSFAEYTIFSVSVSVSVVLVYAFLGLYEIYARRGLWEHIFRLFLGVFLVFLGIITYFFFNEYNRDILPVGVPISRFILAASGFVALYFVFLGRIIFWLIEQILYQLGFGKIAVAVIGDTQNTFSKRLSGFNNIENIYTYSQLDQLSLDQITRLVQDGIVSEIYLLSDTHRLGSKLAILAERKKVDFIFSPEGFSDYQSFGLNPITIERKLLLELKHSNLDGWQVVLKRIFDITFSGLFVILASWLYFIIAIAIKIDSKGPIFYRSERVGPNGKVFRLWKFRRLKQEFSTSENSPETLKLEQELIAKQDARKDGVLYKIKDDPRSTKVGRFIEKYSLDEIPQFFNVLAGEMSIVGPRPHQPREVAKYKDHHYKVFNINPGITGYAQINGRSDINFENEVKYDVYYIENWNFWLDIWIIIKTPFVILFNRHTS